VPVPPAQPRKKEKDSLELRLALEEKQKAMQRLSFLKELEERRKITFRGQKDTELRRLASANALIAKEEAKNPPDVVIIPPMPIPPHHDNQEPVPAPPGTLQQVLSYLQGKDTASGASSSQ